MSFSKWHAHGNAYLVVESDEVTAERVRKLCEREGADGVLEVLATAAAAVEARVWNPDGSTAEISGNGARIAARWLADRTGAEVVTVRVGGRELRATMLASGDVRLEMGTVEVGARETLEVDGELVELTPVAVGNPHAVVRRDPDRRTLLRLGPAIERNPRFPERTNVQLVRVEGTHELTAVVWERGAGETTASGSSAVAVAAAAVANGWCESPVTVRMPGGDLLVELDADNRAALTGPAVRLTQYPQASGGSRHPGSSAQ